MHIRFELQFFKRSDIQHIPFVESIFPFIIIIDYGRLQQSTDEGKRVYISWDCNRLNLSSHVCQVINYLEIEIMILIICFEELISTFNDKFRSMFLKNCVWKDILLMLVQCTFELNVPFLSFWRTAPLLSWGLLIEHQLQFNFLTLKQFISPCLMYWLPFTAEFRPH